MFDFEGYHGTSLESAKNILISEFELSFGDREWLGNGVYFFIQGLSSKPEIQAEKWAISQAWNNVSKTYSYNNFCVLKSKILVSENTFLDLTTEEGLEVFEYLSDKFENKIKELSKKLKYLDGLLINLARSEGILEINVVKANFYIKFAKERVKNINLRANNCTICAVYNPIKTLSEISITKIGTIENEII